MRMMLKIIGLSSIEIKMEIGTVLFSNVDKLKVYRYRKEGKRGIMPKDKVIYYNQIDIGIFLCFLELCLDKNGMKFDRILYVEENVDDEKNLIAEYKLK